MFTCNVFAQHPEAHKLDKQIQATMDSATHSMMMFILKQDTTHYVDAQAKVVRAKALTKEYKALILKRKRDEWKNGCRRSRLSCRRN